MKSVAIPQLGKATGEIVVYMALKVTQCSQVNVELPPQIGAHLTSRCIACPW